MMIGGVKDLEEFNETQEIKRTQTIKGLEEGKEGEFCKSTGLACNDRQRLIKSAIRIIIDNVLPSRLRILFNLCEQTTNETSFEDIDKLFKMDLKSFEVESKNPKYCGLDILHYHTGVNPEFHYKFKIGDGLQHFIKFKHGFEKCIHNLIRARNRILNLQIKFRRFDNPDRLGLTPENVIQFYKVTKTMEHDPQYDIFNTWNIKKAERKDKDDYYSEVGSSVEMSDSDELDDSEFEID